MRSHRLLFALLVAVALLTVGCAGPSEEMIEQDETMTLAPGSTASMPLVLEEAADADPDAVSAEASEEGIEASITHSAGGDEAFTAWLTVNASEDAAEGETFVDLDVDGEAKTVAVEVQEPEDPIEEGQSHLIEFTARTQEGQLVMTNDEQVAQAPFGTVADYQEPSSFEPAEIQVVQQGQMPELIDALIGSGTGHSVTTDVPIPAKSEQTQPREETIPRELTVEIQQQIPAQQAQMFLPPDAEEGDEVDFPGTQQGDMLPYVITEKTQEQITLEFAREEGENLTLHAPWPDAAEVTEVGSEQATVYLTPDAEEGEALTWIEPWGEVTEIVEISEQQIVLRHTPEEGQTFERFDRQTQQQVVYEIGEVTEDEIVVLRDNPSPLAGQTLIFDLTIVDRDEADPESGQPQPQPE